ncbi:MAG: hypothetical protein ACRDTP_02435 [Mycobacteriales bacterium]
MSACPGIVLLVALPTVLALAPAAVAADGPGVSPPITITSPPSTAAPSTTSASSAPSTSAAPPTSASTHRATSSPHRTHSTTSYRVRSTAAPYSISESQTGGPTQTFVLGTGSLGSLSSSSIPSVATSPAAGSSSEDSTSHYVHVFFGVIVVAALLLAAGIAGLVFTRDAGGRHR